MTRRSHRPRSRAQALVEFALVLPIFLLILMTMIDFGRVIYAQHTINQAAREGSRAGSVSVEDLDNNAKFTARFQKIRDAAKTMALGVTMTDANIHGSAAHGDCTSAVGTPGMPQDATAPGTCFYPNGASTTNQLEPSRVVVKIDVTVPLLTPIIGNILGGSIPLSATSEELLRS